MDGTSKTNYTLTYAQLCSEVMNEVEGSVLTPRTLSLPTMVRFHMTVYFKNVKLYSKGRIQGYQMVRRKRRKYDSIKLWKEEISNSLEVKEI